jgi:DNA topoisomerase-1
MNTSEKPRGLIWSRLDRPGISRRRSGKGFSYRHADGKQIKAAATLKRIRLLAIPPAWEDVWISPEENSHIQAVGLDARGRRQYRYHAKFREARDSSKFDHMLAFASALPRLRSRIRADMSKPGIGRDKVLATVTHLLETTLVRVGNASYAKDNKSYGLTTLLDRHVKITGTELKFEFTGKSGKTWKLGFKDRRIARLVRSCQELPGQHLFQYLDDNGQRQAVTSSDVNAYLKEITGDDITAKDFRTWTGTILAALALTQFEPPDTETMAKANVRAAIETVAKRLGNTPTVCRKCYVHPDLIDAYLDSELQLRLRGRTTGSKSKPSHGLRPEEAAVLAFLQARANRSVKRAA